MASTGKKGKKKGVVVSLQSFLANENTQPGLTQVAKKVRNRLDESDDEDSHSLPQIYQLPTAPRAARYLDDDSVPHKPPFLAYLSNLPFDLHEDDLYEFFGGMNIVSIRLPREDGETGRLRGFGYIEFETRDELISAVSLPDPQIRNRRIRIDVSNENDNKRGMNRSRYDGFGGGNREDSGGSWRREQNDNRDEGRRGGYGYNRDRQRDNSNEGGSWRSTEKPSTDTSPRRGGYGDGYRDRGDRGDRERGFGRRDDFRRPQVAAPVDEERPKLNLKPRTLPLPEVKPSADDESDIEENSSTPEPPPAKPKPSGAAPEKVFGSARPVDTAARQKEIEDRLDRERLDKLHLQDEERKQEDEKNDDEAEEDAQDKDEKESREARSWRKRDDDVRPEGDRAYRKWSPDRRGPPRRTDDRRVVTGGQQRDNRDNGPRRDYRDNRDNRGGYDRDNRGYDRDNRYRDNRNDRDDQRSDRDRDFNRDRDRDRSSPTFDKDNKANVRDTKSVPPRDDKAKRDPRPDRPMPKYQPPQGGPMLTNSNKYSGLLDDDDASE